LFRVVWESLGCIAGDRRQNLKPKFAQVPEQSEFTYSAYLVAAGHLYPVPPRAPRVAVRRLAFTRYCNCQYFVVYIAITGGRGGNVILRNSAGGDGVGWGTYTKGGCAKNSIDSCTKTYTQNNILYRLIQRPKAGALATGQAHLCVSMRIRLAFTRYSNIIWLYCNKGGSGRYNMLRNSIGEEGR